MDLSIVIPSYNSAERLGDSLRAIANATGVGGSAWEVIVVDDGSDDNTRAVASDWKAALPSLHYLFLPRSSSSCRARARNVGITAAKGAQLLFLDAGVLPKSDLLQIASAPTRGSIDSVSIYKTVGMFASMPLDPPAASDSVEMMFLIVERMGWRDAREPFLDSWFPETLPAPWLFAWTCALGVSRRAALEIGGFDEGYLGWGAEDIDFAARLASSGAQFVWHGETFAVHVPHQTSTDRELDHKRNARRLHDKLCGRETELFQAWLNAFSVNTFGSRLDQLTLTRVCSPCPFSPADVRSPAERILCAGLRWSNELVGLEPSVVLAHTRPLVGRLQALWPTADARCLLGIALPYSAAHFDRAVVGDLVRLLPRDLARQHLVELGRVARRISVVLGTRHGHEHRLRELSGWPWLSIEDFTGLARESGLVVESTRSLGAATDIVQLRPA